MGTVNDLAGVAVFLSSDAASYITGEIIDVNGGMLMDRAPVNSLWISMKSCLDYKSIKDNANDDRNCPQSG